MLVHIKRGMLFDTVDNLRLPVIVEQTFLRNFISHINQQLIALFVA